MTFPQDMPDNPGDPANTDPEATSADRAEQAAAEAGERDELAEEGDLSQAVEDELAAIDAELAEPGTGEQEAAAAASSDAKRQLQERTEDLQRLSAEYANFRRRTERDRAGIASAAKAEVVGQLLPILDDLILADQHGDLTGPLKSVHDKLRGVLGALKVEEFGAEGDEFNPDIHEAVQDSSTGDEKVIGSVLRRGFKMNDRLLRTAMVIIADRD